MGAGFSYKGLACAWRAI